MKQVIETEVVATGVLYASEAEYQAAQNNQEEKDA